MSHLTNQINPGFSILGVPYPGPLAEDAATNRHFRTYALDYDDTYTTDPPFWDFFIAAALLRGHRVFIVTCRYKHAMPQPPPMMTRHQMICTDMIAKRYYCEQVLKMKVDIWIDDSPEYIIHGR